MCRSNSRFFRVVLAFAVFVISHVCLLTIAMPQIGLAAGEPGITKYRSPDRVEAGQPVTVTIRIEGSSGEVPEPVPFDGVLVIDQSGSMADNDPSNKRIDAAESFVDCVAPMSRLGIVKY